MDTNLKPRFDAAESVFVERALLWIEEQAYNIVLPPMEGRKYVPVDNKTPPGAKFTAYRQYTRTGLARLITERGADLPNASVFVREFIHQFYPLGAAYEYNYLDLLAAAMQAANGGPPLNLDLEGATAAMEAIEKKLDIIAAFGSGSAGTFGLDSDFDVGMVGLVNLPSMNAYTVATGMAGSQAFADKTPDEVIADLNGIVAAQIDLTYKAFVPDSMLLPVAQYESIAGRSMGDGRSDTILSYFRKTSQHIKEVDSWIYLKGAGGTSVDRMMVYKKDPRMLRHMINMEFQQLPPQLEGMTYRVACLAQSAGVISPYPISVSYGDGI